jgi:photosystem II stability/assembly factor-like uncharacterized protein
MVRRIFVPFAICAGLLAATGAALSVAVPPTDWKITGPFGGTAITVAVDPESPKTVLAGARNTLLYASQDFGGTWEALDFPKRNLGEVTSIIIDPANSMHYVVGVLDAFGGGLFQSQDAGKSWTITPDIKDFGVRALAVSMSNPSEFVAGTLHGVMMSSDSGKTWTRISDPNNLEMQGITSLAIDPKDGNVIYAGTSHLPWKTTDGGKTWESIHSGMIDDSDVFSIYVDPAQPEDVFASACSGIYSSLNRGDSWKKLAGIPNTSRRTHVIRRDRMQPNVIYAGTTTGLFKSSNGGLIWKTVNSAQVNSIAFDPAQPTTMYMAMEYEGIGKTQNGGETITPINNGFVDRQISAVTKSGGKFVAIESQIGESTGLFTSADQGETWSQVRNVKGLSGVHLRYITGTADQDKVLLAGTSHELVKSIDGGQIWRPFALRMIVTPPTHAAPTHAAPAHVTTAHTRTKTAPRRASVKPRTILKTVTPTTIYGLYQMEQGPKGTLYVATNLGLFRSSDLGEEWTQLAMNDATEVTGLYISPNSDGRLVAQTPAGLYMSKDCGDHWDKLSFPLPSSDINGVAIPVDPNARLLAATRVGLYSSSDSGSNWTLESHGMPASTINSVVYRASTQTAFAVQYGKLFQSSDGGNSWTPLSSTLSSPEIRELWVPDNTSTRLYGITSGLGILFRN